MTTNVSSPSTKDQNMTPSEVLRQAAKLIDTPDKWTKGAYAVTSNGMSVEPFDPSARAYCAVGAAAKAGGEQPGLPWIIAVERILFGIFAGAGRVSAFNDAPETKHEDVIMLLLLVAEALDDLT